MNETKNKPEMTKWDKQVVAHLSSLIELDKAGKLEFLPIEQVFANADKKLETIRTQQQAQQSIISYQPNHMAYAI